MPDSPAVASEIAIFGSGALTYSWWQGWERAFPWELDEHDEPPAHWAYKITAEDPMGDGTITAFVTHWSLIGAMNAIAHPHEPWGVDAGPAALHECRAFLFDPDHADFDANTADIVLQVAVYGEAHFG